MNFTQTKLPGVFLIDLDLLEDDRGFFARYFCRQEYAELGLDSNILQINNSFNKSKGTLRGIHYQTNPFGEVKIVRCIAGSLFDVVIDLRVGSPSFLQWIGVELSSDNRRMLYVPKGCGHGFITTANNTEALYLVTEYYTPGHEGGIRWNDPFFDIKWPVSPQVISSKDDAWSDFNLHNVQSGLYTYRRESE